MDKRNAQQNNDFEPRVGDTVSCDSLHYVGRGRVIECLPFEQMCLIEGIDERWQAWFYYHELTQQPDPSGIDSYPEYDGEIFVV